MCVGSRCLDGGPATPGRSLSELGNASVCLTTSVSLTIEFDPGANGTTLEEQLHQAVREYEYMLALVADLQNKDDDDANSTSGSSGGGSGGTSGSDGNDDDSKCSPTIGVDITSPPPPPVPPLSPGPMSPSPAPPPYIPLDDCKCEDYPGVEAVVDALAMVLSSLASPPPLTSCAYSDYDYLFGADFNCSLLDVSDALRQGQLRVGEVSADPSYGSNLSTLRSSTTSPGARACPLFTKRVCGCRYMCDWNMPPTATLEVHLDNSALLRFSEPVLSPWGAQAELTRLGIQMYDLFPEQPHMEWSNQLITPVNDSLGATDFLLNWTWHVAPKGGEALHVYIAPRTVIGVHGGLNQEMALVATLLDKTPPVFAPSLAADEGLDWFPPHTVRDHQRCVPPLVGF